MPEQLHPPYDSSATIRPRQLNRWLDVNAQNGPLGRTQTYIVLPPFTQPVIWLGYSDCVATFNFEAPNNFSLVGLKGNPFEGLLSPLPINPNYMLCIMWVDSTTTPYTVHRYSLWNGVGEVMYIPYPLYTGQLIKKNFRLEVWSVKSQATASQAAPITFYTSKLGNLDYRYGLDMPLQGADPITTNFGNNTSIPTYPAGFGLLLSADALSVLNNAYPIFIGWQTSYPQYPGGYIFNATGSHITITEPLSNPAFLSPTISINDTYLSAVTSQMGVMAMVLCCKVTSAEAANTFLFSAYPTGITLFWNNGTVTSGGSGPNIPGLSYNVWYTMILFLNGGQMSLYVYNTALGTLVGSATNLAPAVTYTSTLALGNCGVEFLEFAVGGTTPSVGDLNSINQYMTNKYFGLQPAWSLPFVWPQYATPQLN